MKVLYHHRTHAEDGQAVHIRALIEAFRAEGHLVREVALVERAGGDRLKAVAETRPPEGGTPNSEGASKAEGEGLDPRGNESNAEGERGSVRFGVPPSGGPAGRETEAKASNAEEERGSVRFGVPPLGGPAGREAAQASGRSRWGWVKRLPPFAMELAEYGYGFPASWRLVAAAREFAPDFLYERYAFGNRAGRITARRTGLPWVLEVNSPMVHELSRTRGLAFPALARRVEREILTAADVVAVVTGVLGEMLAEIGVARERLLVTPNGVNLDLYATSDRAGARAALSIGHVHGPVLGFTGYLRDWHGLDAVATLLAERPLAEAHLCVVGEGPGTAALLAAAERAGTRARVHLAGAFPHARIPALLPAFDVALVPAINPYASPLKLHEYMAASLAIVAPDQPNLREVLAHGENAWLVRPGDQASLALALTELVRDSALARRLGAAARATIESRDLTWRGNVRRILRAVEVLR